MNKLMYIRIQVLAFLSLFCLGNGVLAADLKLAYVDTVKVIESAPQSKAALAKLEAEFGPRDKKLVETRNKIKKLEDSLDNDTGTIPAGERSNIERQIINLKRNLRRDTQEFREDYNIRRNEELASLQKLVYRVISELSRREKYDLVVHEGAVYASKNIDITDKVLEVLRKRSAK